MEKDMYSYLQSYLPEGFISSLRAEMEKSTPNKGFVLNRAKCSEETLKEDVPSCEKDKRLENLFRYSQDECTPGREVLHSAGAYYILDPSAYEAISHLGFAKREIVLDMCAAPGGKTISYALNNPDSIIIANDISSQRAQELSSNVERMGLANVIVTSFDPSYFLINYQGFFTKIILDAPCSGTGMFRKEEKMKDDWDYEKTLHLLPIQDNLLSIAYKLLKKGGELIYITCSFLKEEDEDRISAFLLSHPDMKTEDVKMEEGYYEGTVKNTVHLFPNVFKGEGHFFALLKKDGMEETEWPLYRKAVLDERLGLYTFSYNKETYGLKYPLQPLLSLPSLRMGVKLTDSFEYSKIKEDHALSHYLPSSSSLPLSKEDSYRYLRGEELKSKSEIKDGTVIFSYKGINLGFGKKKGDRIHNCYPKGLRLRNI
jgi:16S rRNA C967 or C1407 C5-methylase (RsmB/RsmF family)/NOL1/NOP2/fmu family ribosome biogenesis protein